MEKYRKDALNMGIVIRRAEQEDQSELQRLLKYIAALHHAGRPDIFRSGSSKYDAAQLAEILQDERKPVFVAADETRHVFGYAFCIVRESGGDALLNSRRILYVDDLCVEEQSRGRGLGRALLEEVKKHALFLGAQSVELNVWNFNQSAVSFYEHLGFSVQKSILELLLNPSL